jgi:hypothetical protein
MRLQPICTKLWGMKKCILIGIGEKKKGRFSDADGYNYPAFIGMER